jgi:hypothetical protein
MPIRPENRKRYPKKMNKSCTGGQVISGTRKCPANPGGSGCLQ